MGCLVIKYIIGIILIVPFVSSENILDKYPPGLRYLNFLTCRNRCGLEQLVCSCRSRCRAYRNCCEDFQEKCPIEFHDTGKISHVFGYPVECTPYNPMFMIGACFKDPETTGHPHKSSSESAGTTVAATEFPVARDAVSPWVARDAVSPWVAMLRSLYDSRPVVDLYSGLVFDSYQTFSCHSLEQSVPVSLDVQIRFKSKTDIPEISELAQSIPVKRDEVVGYTFPSQVKESEFRVPCLMNAYSYCYGGNGEEFEAARHKCHSFTSYVVSVDEEATYFKNVYCMKCYNSSYDVYRVVNKWKSNRQNMAFSALVRFTPEGIVLDAGDSNTFWKEAVCSYVDDVGETTGNTACSVTQCKQGKSKNSHGVCSYKRKFRIAVDNGGFPLTLWQLQRLPSVYACLLEGDGTTSTEFSVDEDQRSTIMPLGAYDLALDKMLFYFEINILSQSFDYIFANSTLARSLHFANELVYKHTRRKFREDKVTIGNKSLEDGHGHESSFCDLKNGTTAKSTVVCACMVEQEVNLTCHVSCEFGTVSEPCEPQQMENIVEPECFEAFLPSGSPLWKLSTLLSGQMLAIIISYSF